jgi:hypothetical protein
VPTFDKSTDKGGRKVVKNENVLKNAESFSVELLLLSYPLLLLSGDIAISPHYLLLVLSVIAGTGIYFLLNAFTYTVGIGLMVSLFVSMPLFIIGMPLAPTILVGAYTFWRIHTNFSSERHARWNFMAVNTIVFTVFYLITTIYLLQPEKTEFNQVHVVLFIATTVLYIILRYIVVMITGKWVPNFQFKEVHKMFGSVLGIGTVTFITVYYFIESFRSVIINVFIMLFGNLFKKTASLLPEVELPNQAIPEDEPLDEVLIEMPTSSDQINLGLFITIIAIAVAIILVIMILKKRKITIEIMKMPSYSFRPFGLNKRTVIKNQDLNLLSTTTVVRLAYQEIEKDADLAKSSRLASETVKEWFHRMGWEQDNQLIMTYDKVRYASLTISEEESRQFVETLNKIKVNNFH